MSPLTIVVLFVFLMAYYYFVLRKYNSLGFRMLSLFTFVSIAVTYWIVSDQIALRDAENNGLKTTATVVSKTRNGQNNIVRLRFMAPDGKTIEQTQNSGVSDQEFASVSEGAATPVLYSPKFNAVYLVASYERQRRDGPWILIFPAVLFLCGIGCWFWMKKYTVHAHEGTMYEYVTDQQGNVVLDDAKNTTTKVLRVGSTLSKFLQLFRS